MSQTVKINFIFLAVLLSPMVLLYQNTALNTAAVLTLIILYFRSMVINQQDQIRSNEEELKSLRESVTAQYNALRAYNSDLKSLDRTVKAVKKSSELSAKRSHKILVQGSATTKKERRYSPQAWREPEIKLNAPRTEARNQK